MTEETATVEKTPETPEVSEEDLTTAQKAVYDGWASMAFAHVLEEYPKLAKRLEVFKEAPPFEVDQRTKDVSFSRDFVTLFAKSSCNTCYGRGEYKVSRPYKVSGATNVHNLQVSIELCGCATRCVNKLARRLPKLPSDDLILKIAQSLPKMEDSGESTVEVPITKENVENVDG